MRTDFSVPFSFILLCLSTHDIGGQTGEVLVLDVVVSEQPQGRVDQRVVYITAHRDGRVDLAQFCSVDEGRFRKRRQARYDRQAGHEEGRVFALLA